MLQGASNWLHSVVDLVFNWIEFNNIELLLSVLELVLRQNNNWRKTAFNGVQPPTIKLSHLRN
jgi:hypothetical protein